MSNIFTDVDGKERELKSLLEQALESLKEKRMEVEKILLETPPSAFDKGLSDCKTGTLFGFIFKSKPAPRKKHTVTETPSVPTKTSTTRPEAKFNEKTGDKIPYVPRDRKISFREVEMHKQGLKYVCPCGWKSESSTGFKKHFNRCEKRHNV